MGRERRGRGVQTIASISVGVCAISRPPVLIITDRLRAITGLHMQREEDIVFVGKKPVMNYVLACLTMFQNGSADVTLKARGLAIAKAVDAAQITTQRFAPGVTVKG